MKTTIIVLGTSHLDFKLYSVFSKLISQLHDKGIRTSFLEEQIGGVDLDTTIASVTMQKKTGLFLKNFSDPFLSDLYHHDKLTNVKYLRGSDYASVAAKVNENMEHIKAWCTEPIHPRLFFEILSKLNSAIEALKFLDILKKLKTPYVVLEPQEEPMHTEIYGKGSIEIIVKHEASRIETMLKNFFNAIKNHVEGGVIFISVGNFHAQRLAANILLRAQTNNLAGQIDMHVFKISSNVFVENKQNFEQDLYLKRMVDSEEIDKIYQTLPIETLHLQESESSFWEIDFLVNQVIENSAKKKTSHLTAHSTFKPLPHDKLIQELAVYVKENPKSTSTDFFQIVSNKDYSRALRCVCSWGNAKLVKILLNYADRLPFDFSKTCSKGNTPRMLFEASKASESDKKEICDLLIDKELDQTLDLLNL